jgi:hypothetical protein
MSTQGKDSMSTNKPLSFQIVGGLGNQLYGLSAGIVFAQHLHRELVLDFNLVRLGANLSRVPEIQKIDLGELVNQFRSINTQEYPVKLFYEKVRRRFNHSLPSVFSDRIIPNIFWKEIQGYTDTKESVPVQLSQISAGVNTIGGYFTNFDWANRAIEHGFPMVLNPKSPSRAYQSHQKSFLPHSIALHIRLGDYLWLSDTYPILTEDYYLNALNAINYSAGDRIHVFTDSVDQLKTRYPRLMALKNIHVIDPLNEMCAVETMALMSKHDKLIISNSTFSSWAAWFSRSSEVVTPIPHHNNNWEDKLPQLWKRIHINP